MRGGGAFGIRAHSSGETVCCTCILGHIRLWGVAMETLALYHGVIFYLLLFALIVLYDIECSLLYGLHSE